METIPLIFFEPILLYLKVNREMGMCALTDGVINFRIQGKRGTLQKKNLSKKHIQHSFKILKH